jgi:hypothetical protein
MPPTSARLDFSSSVVKLALAEHFGWLELPDNFVIDDRVVEFEAEHFILWGDFITGDLAFVQA